MRISRLVWCLMAVLALALGSACKQGEGDRCEWQADCESGLQCCSTGSKTCQATCTGSFQDAALPHDAAPQLDAAVTADASTH